MTNPFEKRATEYLRDDSAFLSVVTPEPLHTFFEKDAGTGALYDRLAMIIGTPGSGKTTIATLLQYHTVNTLINSPNHSEYKPLYGALMSCKVIEDGKISVDACRIPMESEYRDFWELPYPEDVKFGLLKSFLQSRAVILWLDGLEKTGGYDLDEVSIIYREGASVAEDSLGGTTASSVLKKAKLVERSIYRISAALIPPKIDDIPAEALEPYHPFDAIDTFSVLNDSDTSQLRPLVILDDVHMLHPTQLLLLREWLSKREMKISRWMMMRLDAQTPEAILAEGIDGATTIQGESTIQKSREIIEIWLQSGADRRANRQNFRTMAKSMADKYLRLMPLFQRRGYVTFQNLLNTSPTPISASNLKRLQKKVDSLQQSASIGAETRKTLENEVDKYFSGTSQINHGEDVRLAMLLILLNRFIKRKPQTTMFDNEQELESSTTIKANSDVADGAKIFLLHEYGRPYYYGIHALCDGSSENAEQFLHLANQLVKASEARIIRGKAEELSSKFQHQLLQKKAEDIIRNWIFPRHAEVIQLCNFIAKQCLEKSLEPNASLGGGANAFGIPDEQFSRVAKEYPDLAQVLKFAVAYSALSIKRHHSTKHRNWTLIELTGPYLIETGLTFTRGGFLERDIKDLSKALEGK